MSPAPAWFETFFDARYGSMIESQEGPAAAHRDVRGAILLAQLRPGQRVLDAPCGSGRHAALLARRGLLVTGVDLSRGMLALARKHHGREPNLTLVRGDLRTLPYRREFDAVVNLYSSFGYFGERSDRAVLRRFARALRPGGRLVVEGRDPGWDALHTLPRDWHRPEPGLLILESRRFDVRRRTLHLDWILRRDGRRPEHRHARLREYGADEWPSLLAAVGLDLVGVFAGLDGSPRRDGRSKRLVVVAERQRSPDAKPSAASG